MACLLVLKNDGSLTEALGGYLRQLGHEVVTAPADVDAKPRIGPDIDLVLLDLDYADHRGLAICRAIRDESDACIIAFSASDTELDRVLALQAGADDCVASTCSPHEVAARIDAVMRRARPSTRAADVLRCGRLEINCTSYEASLDGKPVHLTLKEFSLLHELASQPGCVLSRRELMERVWNDSWGQASRTLDTHVNSLRSKLGNSRWIVTVRGVGYRFDVPEQVNPMNVPKQVSQIDVPEQVSQIKEVVRGDVPDRLILRGSGIDALRDSQQPVEVGARFA